MENVIYRL